MSLIAQRQVYDDVHTARVVTAVQMNKSVAQYVRCTHSRYQECLRKKAVSVDEGRKSGDRKRAADLSDLMIQLQKIKKAKIAVSIEIESRNIDRDIAEWEKIVSQKSIMCYCNFCMLRDSPMEYIRPI
jgi:hypothetical protein